MKAKTDGDMSAFPNGYVCVGLTKREYFAAAAMQAFASLDGVDILRTARWAVQQADALIAELNKEPAK